MSHDSGSSSLIQVSLIFRSVGELAFEVSSISKTSEAARTDSHLQQDGEDKKSSHFGSRFQVVRDQGFSKSMAEDISAQQRLSQRRMYSLRVEHFISWAKVHKLDSTCPTVATVAHFFYFCSR